MRAGDGTLRRNGGLAPFHGRVYIPDGRGGMPRAVSSPSSPVLPVAFRGVAPMSQTRPAAAFTTALLLARSEDFAVIDRRALREAGIGQVRVLTEGLYAARFLAGREKSDQSPQPDIVIVHEQLADMNGADFAQLVRTHPRLSSLPVLCVSAGDTPGEKLKALAEGYSALLVRPYSGENMRRALHEAASFRAEKEKLNLGRALLNTDLFDKALERFEALRSACAEPEESFNNGLLLLQKKQWDEAIHAFQKALRGLSCRGEAEYGIALAWKGKGEQEKYRHWLALAGQSFAQAAKWQRARMAYARLLHDAPQAQSPFLLEAERLIRAGLFDEAATALAEGYELTPKAPLRERLARTFIYAGEYPEKDADAFRRSLSDKAPEAARQIAEDVREEIGEQKRRMKERAEAAAVPGKGAPRAPLRLGSLVDEDADMDFSDTDAAPGSPKVIEPLSAKDLGSSLFSDKPGMNEVVTVAKLTWKLFRSGKL